ncbi:DUF7344 domain-containing protein [Haloarchaeobius sp. DFWS5]|uniref:DUF7344 domain-containing protein n=1 Tax=Haloarchaeobius sp. DFWS5 TaxID=3446114 RepID=UPI003EB93D17
MSATVDEGERTTEVPEELLSDDADDFTKDDMFHLLQNRRRRDVLRYLQGVDDPVRMRDIAEQVAAWEHDTTVQRLTSKERQRVYIALYQSHLPALDEQGVIDYNQDRGIVERCELADELDPYLGTPSTDDEHEEVELAETTQNWTRYNLAATGFGVALLAGTEFGITGLSSSVAALSVVALFALLTGTMVLAGRETAN